MASRSFCGSGFIVSNGAIRLKNDRNKKSKKQTKPTIQKKKKKKPEWDDTVSDLNVYKSSPEKLVRRHEAHKSKNAGWAKSIQDQENHDQSLTSESCTKRKQAILQEILYGQDNFQAVLDETDTTMSAVKDLFGDDPKKFLGFPNVMVAPKPEKHSESCDISTSRYISGPFAEMPETPTHLSLLSDSIMRTPALNEMSDNAESESSESEENIPEDTQQSVIRNMFEPQLDLKHYRQLISHEVKDSVQKNKGKQKMLHPVVNVDSTSISSGNVSHTSNDVQNTTCSYSVPHKSTGIPTVIDQIPSSERHTNTQSKMAINPMAKARNKLKGQPKPTDTSTSSTTSSLRSLEDLKKMVERLEDEIAEYEMETGRQASNTTPQSRNLSGYTSSLIMAVTKLMRYLKETEMQRKSDALLRDQILQGFSEQRALVDALTNDIVQTQEQNMKLQTELHFYRQNTDNQLNYLKKELEVVLKSFEYHTVQCTINTLYSTTPISLGATSEDHENPPGCITTDQHSYKQAGAVQEHIRTERAFIPVSSASRKELNKKKQRNNAGQSHDDKPSSHVHFRLPQEEINNKPTLNQKANGNMPETSPSISPIPHQDYADVPEVKKTGLKKEKHVVVNLPYMWSDVSSSNISV